MLARVRVGSLLTTIALLAALAGVSAAEAAMPKPKPWQWKSEKVVARLTAATPIPPTEIGNDILSARCSGAGRGVQGRFSRFVCETRWGGSNGSYISTLSIRILAVGTGKLCVVTKPVPGPYGYHHAVAPDGQGGPPISPERRCP